MWLYTLFNTHQKLVLFPKREYLKHNWIWSIKACREHIVCQITLLYIYWKKAKPIWSTKPIEALGHCSLLAKVKGQGLFQLTSWDSCNKIQHDFFSLLDSFQMYSVQKTQLLHLLSVSIFIIQQSHVNKARCICVHLQVLVTH